MKIDGRFWLTKDGENFLGSGRIELLEKIAETGSILAAAKAMKMSYKAAWERIEAMNRLSERPIIERTTGGKGGGGTVLTPYAYELIATFKRFNELHRQFIDRFAEAGNDPERLARILSRTFLTTSARNQLPCTVSGIESAGLNTLLTLALEGGDVLHSIITEKSVRSMGLELGAEAYAIIKSSDVRFVAHKPNNDGENNLIPGTVEAMESAGDDVEISLRLNGGALLVALLSLSDADGLSIGSKAYALISPKHIIIGL